MLERLVETFCAVEDFCKAFVPHWEAYLIGHGSAPRGPAPGLSVSEIITLLLMLMAQGPNISRIFTMGWSEKYCAAIFPACRVMSGL